MSWKELEFRLEAVAVWIIFRIFAILPIDTASAVGGWIGRTVGYHLPVTRHARRNLTRFFPDWSDGEREAVLLRMWDNIGRTAGEYPHLPELTYGPGGRVEIVPVFFSVAISAIGKFSGHSPRTTASLCI
jgi:KDO2-lipid IV(A) lauroyltransferase